MSYLVNYALNSGAFDAFDKSVVQRLRCLSYDCRSQETSAKQDNAFKQRIYEKSFDREKRDLLARDQALQPTLSNPATSPPTTILNSEVSPSPTIALATANTIWSSPKTSLEAPIIVVIIISSIISIISLIFLIRGRKKKLKDTEKDSLSKEENLVDRSSTLESSFLHYDRGSGDFNVCNASLTRAVTSAPKENIIITDLEKAQVVEPPLDMHPAYKSVHTQNSKPLCTAKSIENLAPISLFECQQENKYCSTPPEDEGKHRFAKRKAPQDTGLSDQELYNDNACRRPSSDGESSLYSASEHFLGTESNTDDEGSDQEEMQEINIRQKLISDTRSCPKKALASKDIKFTTFETEDRNECQENMCNNRTFKPDVSDHVHIVSRRWSKSSCASESLSINLTSDWSMPGAWGSLIGPDDNI